MTPCAALLTAVLVGPRHFNLRLQILPGASVAKATAGHGRPGEEIAARATAVHHYGGTVARCREIK